MKGFILQGKAAEMMLLRERSAKSPRPPGKAGRYEQK